MAVVCFSQELPLLQSVLVGTPSNKCYHNYMYMYNSYWKLAPLKVTGFNWRWAFYGILLVTCCQCYRGCIGRLAFMKHTSMNSTFVTLLLIWRWRGEGCVRGHGRWRSIKLLFHEVWHHPDSNTVTKHIDSCPEAIPASKWTQLQQSNKLH